MSARLRPLLVMLLAAAALMMPSGLALASAPEDPVEPTPPSFVDNDFIPEDVNLSACRSGVPRPNCGSENRGGLRQGLVFGAIVVGIAFIGWRIRREMRRTS